MCTGLEKTLFHPMSHQSLHRTYVMHLSFNLFLMPLIVGILTFFHISSFIKNSLHWFPIRQRIQLKICTLARNSLTGSAPCTIPQGLLYPGIFYTWSFHPSIFGSGTLGCPPDTRMSMTQS